VNNVIFGKISVGKGGKRKKTLTRKKLVGQLSIKKGELVPDKKKVLKGHS